MDQNFTGKLVTTVVILALTLQSSARGMQTNESSTMVDPDEDSEASTSPTWIFIHGSFGGSWIWYKMQVLLEDDGFPVVALDLTSHGIGEDARTPDSVLSINEWASPLLDFLSNFTGSGILVTHGLGGAAVSVAMELYPEKISKAVFVAAVMPLDGVPVNQYIKDDVEELVRAGIFRLKYGEGIMAYPTSVEIDFDVAKRILFARTPNEVSEDMLFPQMWNPEPASAEIKVKDINLLRDLLAPFPYRPFQEALTLTNERYGSVTRYYITVGLDNMIPISDQLSICHDSPPNLQLNLKYGDHAPMFSEAPYLYFMLKNILRY